MVYVATIVWWNKHIDILAKPAPNLQYHIQWHKAKAWHLYSVTSLLAFADFPSLYRLRYNKEWQKMRLMQDKANTDYIDECIHQVHSRNKATNTSM